MDLTDEQWALIQPIITSDKYLSREGTDPDRVASERGRGPIPNPSQLPACTRDGGPGERRPEPGEGCSRRTDTDQGSTLPSPNNISGSRGRPPADPRATLDGILRKIRLAAPWYDLPPYTSDQHAPPLTQGGTSLKKYFYFFYSKCKSPLLWGPP